MVRPFKSLLVPLAIALVTGCIPMIRVDVMQPARYNLGASKQLSVVETTGRRSAREVVVAQLMQRARGDGHFTATDRSEEGISVKVAGQTVTATGGKGTPQRPDEIGLRIDVLEWSANSETKPEVRDSKGKVTQKERKVWMGKVLLGVTAFNASGKAYLAETEFDGEPVEAETEEEAIKAASMVAVNKMMSAITPRRVQKQIRMDGDDEKLKPIIEVAKAGNLDRAGTELKGVLEKEPNNPSALYNMAVILDAQGKYEEALDHYTKAISNSTKEYYVDMKAECAERLANQQALSK